MKHRPCSIASTMFSECPIICTSYRVRFQGVLLSRGRNRFNAYSFGGFTHGESHVEKVAGGTVTYRSR